MLVLLLRSAGRQCCLIRQAWAEDWIDNILPEDLTMLNSLKQTGEVEETSNDIVVRIELPGMDKAQARFGNGVLTVRLPKNGGGDGAKSIRVT